MAFGLLVATIDFYHIAEALEGVERQTYGQDEVCLVEETLVFEDKEDGEGRDDAGHQPSFTFARIATTALNHQRCEIVNDDSGEEYEYIYRLEPHVEETAGCQKPSPTPLVGQ